MLALNGVAPTKENIVAKKYPFARPLYLVVPRAAKPEVREFVGFVLSRQGAGADRLLRHRLARRHALTGRQAATPCRSCTPRCSSCTV